MSWIFGFVAKFLVGLIENFRRDRALIDKGRIEQELEQSKATVEVISRNAEGQQAVDGMTEEESILDLTKP